MNHPNRSKRAKLVYTLTDMQTIVAAANALRAENARLREAATKLLSHYTSAPHCGHTFTCTCKDADIAALRVALEAR